MVKVLQIPCISLDFPMALKALDGSLLPAIIHTLRLILRTLGNHSDEISFFFNQ